MSESRFLPGRWVRIRTYGAVSLIALCFCTLGYRAWVLQVRESERLKAMAEDQYLRDIEIPPRRGRILDRNGVELAASVEIDSLACNQRVVGERAAELARALAAPLHTDRRELEKRLHGKKYFAWVKRRLDPDEARAVKELTLPGLSHGARAASLLSAPRSRRTLARLRRARRRRTGRARAAARSRAARVAHAGPGPARRARARGAHRRSRRRADLGGTGRRDHHRSPPPVSPRAGAAGAR